ncbi:hypothetical protein WA158_001339 [Blastocystis sp. Blastoise]
MENISKAIEVKVQDIELQFNTFIERQISDFNVYESTMIDRISSLKETINKLKNQSNDLQTDNERKEQLNKQHKEEINLYQEQLLVVKKEYDEYNKEYEQYEKDLAVEQKTFSDETKKVQELYEEINSITNDTTLGIKYFKDYLGITFNNLKNMQSIKIVFQYIDPNHWEKEYSIILSLDEQRKWKVMNCIPMISDLDKLEASLQQTNNLSSFVIHVRQGFLQLV